MSGQFLPSHKAPDGGLQAWAAPNPAEPVAATIEARVEMQVLERTGDWAHVECSNGWKAWVDARRLVPIFAAPPVSAPPVSGPPVTSTAVSAPAPGTPARPAAAAGVLAALAKPVMTVGPRTVVVSDLVPAVGILIGALLPWLSLGAFGSGNSFEAPLLFLVDTTPNSTGLKLGWLLLVAAVATVAPPQREIRQVAMGVGVGAAVLFAFQLQRLLSQTQTGTSLGSVLGFGVFVTAAAGAAGLILGRYVRD